jgi:DNA-binding beta-propeller fold protein YncE
VRKISLDGIITTFAGTGFPGYSGDGGPAAKAALLYPGSLAVDALGSVYVTTADSRVRKIDSAGTITLVAGRGEGTGTVRFSGDGGPAIDAIMNGPAGVAVDAAGNVYITDSQNARLRHHDPRLRTCGIVDALLEDR